ncbi:MAG: hypothetical protein N3B21_04630 [Clostridia bacterium]|nr:hypothetical protein [Clostridia bacterium]
MTITAVIARIENGNAILLADEIGIEISVPADIIEGTYNEGEVLTLTLDKDGNINGLD